MKQENWLAYAIVLTVLVVGYIAAIFWLATKAAW